MAGQKTQTLDALYSNLLLFACTLILTGCINSGQTEPPIVAEKHSAKKVVCVSNYPLKYFADRIAGGTFEVRFLVEDSVDPAFWKPQPKMIASLQAADLILINGATYEKWLPSVTLPEAKLIDTSNSFADKFIQIENAESHSHGPEGMHSHAGTAFTTWIDFDQAERQAIAVKVAFATLQPDAATKFDKNLADLIADLRQLDEQMKEVAKSIGNRPLVASHPVYDYMARRYSLSLKSVLWEPDLVPTNEDIDNLQKLLEGHRANVMIWEGVPKPESVEKLKAIKIASVVFDPGGGAPDEGDWLTAMRSNINSLRAWANAQ